MNRCPRCSGNLLIEWDIYDGLIYNCLQCSYQCNLDLTSWTRKPTLKEKVTSHFQTRRKDRSLSLPL